LPGARSSLGLARRRRGPALAGGYVAAGTFRVRAGLWGGDKRWARLVMLVAVVVFCAVVVLVVGAFVLGVGAR
jgi:hypothetical protein